MFKLPYTRWAFIWILILSKKQTILLYSIAIGYIFIRIPFYEELKIIINKLTGLKLWLLMIV